MSFTVPGITPDGGPVEGAPVLEPIEHSVLGKSLDGGLQEWMLVLEPLEHSVPVITWIDGPMEGTPVLEPLEHSVLEKSSHDEPMEGAPVLEPLEHSVLKKASGRWITGGNIGRGLGCTTCYGTVRAFGSGDNFSVGAVEHSNSIITDHVDIDSLWMAPWDPGGTLDDSCRPSVATWRTVFRSVV